MDVGGDVVVAAVVEAVGVALWLVLQQLFDVEALCLGLKHNV